jgi:hypothetical protein
LFLILIDLATKGQAFFGPDTVNYKTSPHQDEEEKNEMEQLELKLSKVNFNSDIAFNDLK